jgi:hypothetical protein
VFSSKPIRQNGTQGFDLRRLAPVFFTLLASALAAPVDIAPFALPCCSADEHKLQTAFDYGHPAGVQPYHGGGFAAGLQWREERDLAEVAVRFRTAYDGSRVRVQYWFQNWPYPRPTGHTVEDPLDDPWQGRWLTAAVEPACTGTTCRFRFLPLAAAENPRALNLPGVTYRRAVKVRVLFPAGAKPGVDALQVFTPSAARQFAFQLRFCDGTAGEAPRLEAYNGTVRSSKVSGCEATVTVDGMEPQPAGSNDVTLIKVRAAKGAFSFALADLDRGPMVLPDFGVSIRTEGIPPAAIARATQRGQRIRERLLAEPEQSYGRASREIPPLEPAGHLQLPLAADASWQKFELEWGGHVRISKNRTKAFGRELERLTWPGDSIYWRIGTGAKPTFRPASGDSTLAQFENSLPLATARWESEGLEYEQEAFATLLSGPLSPDDPGRSERTPAVLMMRITVRNRSAAARPANLWIAMRPSEPLAFDGHLLTTADGKSVRALVSLPEGAAASLATCVEKDAAAPALHLTGTLPEQAEATAYVSIPFVPGLTADERTQLAALTFDGQRERVLAYWREATRNAVPFHVPEERFNAFARGLVARIRLSVTKDPKSGLFMVPAASLKYRVYANEAAFQCQLLDVLGQHALAGKYLKTLSVLQGSKPLLGTFTGDQRDVYYGARVDAGYDYTATPYNLSHGTVLWSLAGHYLYSRDRQWLNEVLPGMKRAARWIAAQRALTAKTLTSGERVPEFGLLPAGHLEDNHDWAHWFSVNAYASAGMTSLAKVLGEIGDSEAVEFDREARLYRDDLRAAVLRAAEDAAVVRLRDNTFVPYVPTRVHQRLRQYGPQRVGYYSRYGMVDMPTFRLSATRELLFGPISLFDTSVFGAGEPLARWVLDDWEDNQTTSHPLGINVHGWVDEDLWFSRGGMVFQANLQNPIRTYLWRGEIRAALRSFYNDFVACYYPAVNVFTEEYRRWRFPSGPFFKVADEAKFTHRLRDLLVTEQDGSLELARGTPAAWLAEGQEIVVKDAPTQYGPVSYTLRATAGEIRGRVELPARTRYRDAWISVRVPEPSVITAVTIDGQPSRDFSPQSGRVHLPASDRPLALAVSISRR